MKAKYFILILFIFFFLSLNVDASDCDSQDIANLKELSKGINYQYNYVGVKDSVVDYQAYDIYFEGLGKEFFITDSGNNYMIEKDMDSFTIDSGDNNFKVYSSKCNTYLRNININLPKFNEKSLSDYCDGISSDDIEECGEWYQGNISDSQLEAKVDAYNKSLLEDDRALIEKVYDLIVDNYIISTICGIVVLILIVILIRRHYKRNILE